MTKLRAGIEELNAEARAPAGRVRRDQRQLPDPVPGPVRRRHGRAEANRERTIPSKRGWRFTPARPASALASMSLMSWRRAGPDRQRPDLRRLPWPIRPRSACWTKSTRLLDDANVDRYCNMLDEMRRRTQTRFIAITHNPVTMSRMDRLFGVTMGERGGEPARSAWTSARPKSWSRPSRRLAPPGPRPLLPRRGRSDHLPPRLLGADDPA
ncbi:hypothetical protein ACRAWD_13050 [Caulobacter segnis]